MVTPSLPAHVPSLLPSLPTPTPQPEGPLPTVFDLVLRGQRRLTQSLTEPARLPALMQGLLALSVVGLAVHGLVLGLGAQFLGRDAQWLEFYVRGTPLLWMPLSFVLAFVGALCVCLPSFYFYTQLSGLDASFRVVVVQALRAQATTSVLLLGALPFYAAWLLACAAGWANPETALFCGMCLPFAVGLAGLRALYTSFGDLAKQLPITHERRGNFLRRMVWAWGALYSVVAPLALYRLAEQLGQRL